ncbi:MAG: endonuclease III [Candidatus Liptonbacteria bacterium]|nr:endonuclease III [Candidatus Liptonbacteria bacterium]
MTPRQVRERRRRGARILAALKRTLSPPKIALAHANNLELLVAVILSAQCTDKKVNEVTNALFRKYRTLDDYLRVPQEELERDIRPTGFFRMKAKHIRGSVRALKERFGGRLPRTMDEMLTLPGVARKTANVVLGNAYGVVEGIAVDTHVRRLSRLFGLTDETDPVKIERDLMAIFPKKEWFPLTYYFIDYGRTHCSARKHDHAACPLGKFVRA